jgi:undecaprenyl-diphosphatase
MATDVDPGTTRSEAGRGWARRRAHAIATTVGENLRHAHRLAGRRRDRRFSLIPYDAFAIANAAALAASALVLIVVLADPHLTEWQAALPPPLIGFFRFLTDFGSAGWILYSTGLVYIVLLLSDAAHLRARLRARRAVRGTTALYVFAAVALSGIVANLSKNAIGRARPRHFEESGSFAFDFLAGDSGWASFPSGHATTAAALGVALALLFPRLRWVFLALGFWIAVSRLFVRAHYPSDVLAGCLLGAGTAWLLARLLAQRRLVFGFDAEGGLVRRRGVSGRLL